MLNAVATRMQTVDGAGVPPHASTCVPMRLSWLLLLSLSACSPYSFSNEVAHFSTGVDQLSSGFVRGFDALAADRAAKMQLELTGARAKVHVASACLDAEDLNPCELHQLGTDEPTRSDVEDLRGRTMTALAVLRNYAHALAAVTNAADRAAFDAAVGQLSGSVGMLAANANAAAPGASVVAPAVVNVAGWLVGTALDQQRFAALKAGVTAAGTALPGGESPIAKVAEVLGLGLDALREARKDVLVAEVQILEARLGPSLSDADYRQTLGDAQALVTVLDGVRRTNPEAAANALVAAHDALLAAVNDPRLNHASLLQAVGEFADRAAALQAALATAAALEKAADKKES